MTVSVMLRSMQLYYIYPNRKLNKDKENAITYELGTLSLANYAGY